MWGHDLFSSRLAIAARHGDTQILAMWPRGVIRTLQAGGWYQVAQKGSHR